MKRNILNSKRIARIDSENMLGLLISFPEQCEHAICIGRNTPLPGRYKKRYKNIVFLGLGGSAIGGDIIRSYLVEEANIPISVVRGYSLPRFVNKDSLVFATSYSGNTEETLSMYKEAISRKAHLIVITSGGRLERLAIKNGNLLVSIPRGFPPRCALGYCFMPALILLGKLNIVKNQEGVLRDVVFVLKKLLRNDLGLHVNNNISKKIASVIYGKFPVIYTAAKHMDVVAVRWRGQLSENAKTLASHHTYPEMNHNEIVGWRKPSRLLKEFVVISIKDKKDHMRTKARMDITNSILRKAKFKVFELESRERSLLSRMISLIYIGDFVSFYLSIMNRVDPTPVKRISYLKGELARI